jgi:hypothetical protein
MIHYLYIVFFRQCQFAGYGKISHFFGQVDNRHPGSGQKKPHRKTSAALRVEKLLPPPFMGEVARWIRAKPGAAGSEGVPTFQRKVGISEYLLCKYSDSPRPSGTPLINAGGKI